MDFEYKGANCVVITSKNAKVVIDGKLSGVGLKDVMPKDSIAVTTQDNFKPQLSEDNISVDQPGEYEIRDISFKGVAAERMIDYDKSMNATMYRIAYSDLSVGVVGHVAVPLTEEQLEQLGLVDVLIIPVGGHGYTLDASQAMQVVRQIEPKVVIATHYMDSAVKYEVEQDGLDEFIKEYAGNVEETSKWKVKNGVLPEGNTLVKLLRTA